MVITAEGTVVLAWLPGIEFFFQKHNGHWQTVAAEGFRQGDNVRLDTEFFKAEEGTAAATTCLNIVDNQQHVVTLTQRLQAQHPGGRSAVQATFALNTFNDHGGRVSQT